MLSITNDVYKEFTALCINNVEFHVEEKNKKKHIKFKVKDVKGYDFSGIQPKIVFEK